MILTLLRNRTKHLHERIEQTVDLPARLGSATGYAALLTRFFGYYAPLEDRLAGVVGLDTTIDLAARRKSQLLRADLVALCMAEADIFAVPRCPDLPVIADVGDALGCLYVVEGATLGGQIVRREVERRFGLTPGRGCSFFASYGGRVGAMWQEFCWVLEGYAAGTPGAAARIVAAAVGTFVGLEQWVAEGEAC